jgi:hypothetical protein
MLLYQTSIKLLERIAALVQSLDNQHYANSPQILSGSTIAQHVRHIFEFYECLATGATDGIIDYDQRRRDQRMEQDAVYAYERIMGMVALLRETAAKPDLALRVRVTFGNESVIVPSSFERELYYNIEHAVHHMAIIKMAIFTCCPEIVLPADFGIADSTIRYHQHLSNV